MNEQGVLVAEQYDFEIYKNSRVKGAVLFETDQGLFLLREYNGSEKHLELEEFIENQIREQGQILCDCPLRNKQGELVSQAKDGIKYVMKNWYIGRDCEVKNRQMVEQAVKALAVLHTTMETPVMATEWKESEKNAKNQTMSFEKHTQQLLRCRRYIQGKQNKNEFEWILSSSLESFCEQAKQVSEEYKAQAFDRRMDLKHMGMVHGDYNYHNVAFVERMPFITNFSKCKYGIYIVDLYDFLRKVMEKHNWNVDFGHKLIRTYDSIRRMDNWEYAYLAYLLAFPKKYWKLVNHYMNHKKVWIPDKDIEKLNTVISQEWAKKEFVKSLNYQ